LRKDLILEGNGIQIHKQFYDSISVESRRIGNNNDQEYDQIFTFKLHESENWWPAINSKDFNRLLSNLTSIKIKTTYGGNNILSQFSLQSAVRLSKNELAHFQDHASSILPSIEECKCPTGHSGQFCENCQTGFRREIAYGDSFTKCIPCSCNNHSVSCNPITSKCNCIHHTFGENCELCQDGYYGNALAGTPNDCKKCPCPNDGSCVEIFNYQSNSNEIVCLNCEQGTRGNMCDMCEDGYYEKQQDQLTDDTKNKVCEKCECNSNIDENSIGNCDPLNGNCLRCIYNTTGNSCEKCLPDYWGSALTDLKCHACECSDLGSETSECNRENGNCK
jgi:laminin, gamma 1